MTSTIYARCLEKIFLWKNSFFGGVGGGGSPWPLAPTGLLPGYIWRSSKKPEDN